MELNTIVSEVGTLVDIRDVSVNKELFLPYLLFTGACDAPVSIIKEELPPEFLRHSSFVQIFFSRLFPFFLCGRSFVF